MLEDYADLEFHEADEKKFSVSPGLQQVLLDAMKYAQSITNDNPDICEVVTQYITSINNNSESQAPGILIKIFAEANSHTFHHKHAYTEFVKMAKMKAPDCNFEHENRIWKDNTNFFYEQLAKDAQAGLASQVQQKNNSSINKWCKQHSQQPARVREILNAYSLQRRQLQKLLKSAKDIATLERNCERHRPREGDRALEKSAQKEPQRLKNRLLNPNAHSVTPGLEAHAAGMPVANESVYTLSLQDEPPEQQRTSLDGSRGYPNTYKTHGEVAKIFRSLANEQENLFRSLANEQENLEMTPTVHKTTREAPPLPPECLQQ